MDDIDELVSESLARGPDPPKADLCPTCGHGWHGLGCEVKIWPHCRCGKEDYE